MILVSSTIEITGSPFHRYGLDHSRSNWKAAVVFAWASNRLLVPPRFNLEGRHNNGKLLSDNDLSDYYNLTGATINDKKLLSSKPGKDHITLKLSDSLWRVDSKIKTVFEEHGTTCKVKNIFPSDIVSKHAEIVTDSLGKYNCVHVRMTDHPTRNLMTPGNITDMMNKVCDRELPVYLMTDHTDTSYFNFLIDDGWRVVGYNDFSQLVGIKNHDNYMLYAIERHLLENSNNKITRVNLVSNFNLVAH